MFGTLRWLIYPMIGMRWNGKDLGPFAFCNSWIFRSWSLSQWDFNMSALYKNSKLTEGIDALTSLQTLRIWYCPKLESLPEGFGALTSLQTLDIRGCKKQIGEDWHKISHIPNLEGDLSRQEESQMKKQRNLLVRIGS
nr:putative disease resistance protein rga3 [Quercus suber]